MSSSPSISARQRWPVCRCHGNVRINPACCSPSTDIYNHPELHVRLLTSHHNRMLLNSCKIPEPLISEHVTDVYSRVNLLPTGTHISDCSCQSRYVFIHTRCFMTTWQLTARQKLIELIQVWLKTSTIWLDCWENLHVYQASEELYFPSGCLTFYFSTGSQVDFSILIGIYKIAPTLANQ